MTAAYGRTPWVVFGVGIFAYAVAVMHRSALGVAGLEAAQHFGTSPGIVSTFVVLQLATYSLAQIPVGLLLDRFGSRAILTAGSATILAGQVLLALADDLSAAYVARILVGVGDACIFNSILRLLPRWFHPKRVPVLTQITGMSAGFGQIASVVAVLPLIQTQGWRPGILWSTAVSAVVIVAVFLWVRNAPAGTESAVVSDRLRELPSHLARVTKHPATQLGFWIHFTSGFSMNAFLMMWGMPFLLVGQGRSQLEASSLFTLLSMASMVAGPIVGALTARHPLRRSNLALIVVGGLIVSWALVLLWPGQAPFALLVLLVLMLSVAGPGTGIGFDFPRTNLPATRLGTANGVVITGAFSGGTLLVLAMGIFLDMIAQGQPYTADHLRLAWALQLPFYAVGIVGILVSRRKLRTLMAEQGVIVPSWREVVERIRRRRSGH
ncbi:MAG TPA: MFS transporter [Tessaracoccus flavescens]|uniref:MFS transporter n=1 Tax=Tessaracoccus flavescens TaxID=399497 RepID=A0A921ERE4_9ACTN|nr:MFS transporter [Tessaracoccus flavescens]